jgi:hypothetical protein
MTQINAQQIINAIINQNAKLVKQDSWSLVFADGTIETNIRKGSAESAEYKMSVRRAINLDFVNGGYIVSKKF